MKVSIIIPVYNSVKFLAECINSALNQSYDNIEVIAVDDGSSDGSFEILETFVPKIKIIRKNRVGVAAARNSGIQASTGEWIKLLDHDDVLYPEAIENLLAVAGNLNHSENVIYGNVDFINAQSVVIGQLTELNYNSKDIFDLNTITLDRNFGIPSTWFLHKTVFEKCGFFDEITQHDDFEFHLRCALLFDVRFYSSDVKVAKYRIHPEQFTWKVMRKFKNQDLIALKTLDGLESGVKSKYLLALKQLRSNRSLFEKAAYLFRPVLKFLPVNVEIRLRTLYLKVLEYQRLQDI
ncbi:MAG: glycosyltransferase [Saprospiraceae bacterium]|nr:glycosyltransferase [Saprospiraceae bacterium]MBL0026772.1 glycosyltransferase [Saprospiraceae bacterium]